MKISLAEIIAKAETNNFEYNKFEITLWLYPKNDGISTESIDYIIGLGGTIIDVGQDAFGAKIAMSEVAKIIASNKYDVQIVYQTRNIDELIKIYRDEQVLTIENKLKTKFNYVEAYRTLPSPNGSIRLKVVDNVFSSKNASSRMDRFSEIAEKTLSEEEMCMLSVEILVMNEKENEDIEKEYNNEDIKDEDYWLLLHLRNKIEIFQSGPYCEQEFS